MSVKQLKKALLARAVANRFVQEFLEKRIRRLQWLSGIGSGGNVRSSGEKALCNRLRHLERPPYCIFDVGANKGEFAALILSCLRDKEIASIHCFEPAKAAFLALEKNINRGSLVTLNNIGLGKTAGEFELFYDFAGSGTASLTKRNLDHLDVDFSQSEKVRIDTLDNYCSEKNLERIDLLKIDVEGHELDVLQGSSKMLKDDRIVMVSFEFGGCNIDTRTFFRDFYCFFRDYGFRLYRLTSGGYAYALPSYKEIYEQFRTTMFIAIGQARVEKCSHSKR